MEDHSSQVNHMIINGASKKTLNQGMFSRKRHRKSVKHNKLGAYSEKRLQKNTREKTFSFDGSGQYIPVEERMLKRLKRERKFLKKWTVELNQAQNEINNTTADDFTSVEPKIAEIHKRYHILLPAIKLAVRTMEQAALSKSTVNDASGMNPQRGDEKCSDPRESFYEHITEQGFAENKRPSVHDRNKDHAASAEVPFERAANQNILSPESGISLMTDFSKQQLARRARYLGSKKIQNDSETDFVKETDPQSAKEYCEPAKHICKKRICESRAMYVQRDIPGADSELNNNTYTKPTVLVKGDSLKESVSKLLKDENIHTGHMHVRDKIKARDEANAAPMQTVSCLKERASRNLKAVEQNVLCTGPNLKAANSTPAVSDSLTGETLLNIQRQASFETFSMAPNVKSSSEQCKCKDKRSRKPCICKCYCVEEIYDSKISDEPVLSSVPSSSGEDGRSFRRKPSVESKTLESMQVQTSFPSSLGPCNPDTCPKRRRRYVENRDIEVQTDDTDIEWQYEPTLVLRKTQEFKKTREPKKNVISEFKIPPKRTPSMDDRLFRRVSYFDCHQSSVCNKNVEFCTYNIHQTKKGFPKNAEKVPCSDCPGSRKCNLVLTQCAYHLTCNEVVIEVKSLVLNQEGVDSLTKVCSFIYVDYVFLGHVGNETNLAPISTNVIFDSRKSYSVSLRFNKRERSILRELVTPSGLLVKDSIMFIIVCQAAPELDINKNWDFGFGYLSMKQVGEQIRSEDKLCTAVEMQKIGGTKNNIGRLLVMIEGLKTIKSIMNEKLHCIEPRVNAVMEKLKLYKKELIAAENRQTTCVRRTSKKKIK